MEDILDLTTKRIFTTSYTYFKGPPFSKFIFLPLMITIRKLPLVSSVFSLCVFFFFVLMVVTRHRKCNVDK